MPSDRSTETNIIGLKGPVVCVSGPLFGSCVEADAEVESSSRGLECTQEVQLP